MTGAAVRASGLVKRFDSTIAVDHVDLEGRAGPARRAPHGSHTTGRGQMAGTPAIGRSARTGERLLLRSLEESHTQAERAAAAARIPRAGADTDTDAMRTTQIPRDMSEEHGRDQLRQPSRRARSCCSRAW